MYIAGLDFLEITEELIFEPSERNGVMLDGEVRDCINITIIDDEEGDEALECFDVLAFTDDPRVIVIEPMTTRVCIRDNGRYQYYS